MTNKTITRMLTASAGTTLTLAFALAVPATADPLAPGPLPNPWPVNGSQFPDPTTQGNGQPVPAAPSQQPGGAMPADTPRVNAIGGARISASVPQGLGDGLGPKLIQTEQRTSVTLPNFARNGIFVPVRNGGTAILHLPAEIALKPADWREDGSAFYPGVDNDFVVKPVDGGVDITAFRTNLIGPTSYAIGVRLPDNARLLDRGDVIEIKAPSAQGPEETVGVFSKAVATDTKGVNPSVTTYVAPGSQHQVNIITDLGPADPFALPVDITMHYRPTM